MAERRKVILGGGIDVDVYEQAPASTYCVSSGFTA